MDKDKDKKDPTDINNVSADDHSKVVQERDRLKGAHERLQGEIATLKAQYSKFENVDLEKLLANNEAYQRMLDREAEGTGDESKLQERIDAAVGVVREENLGALTKEKERADNFEKLYKDLAITRTVMNKLAPHIIDQEDAFEFFETLVKKSFSIDENGKLFVKNQDGEKRYKDGTSIEFSEEDWIKEVIEKFPSLAKDKQKSGTKEPGENSSGRPTVRTKTPPPGLSGADLVAWYAANKDAKAPSLPF